MSIGTAIQIEKQRLLLVEGKDEINFFEAILKDSINNIQIIEVGGKSRFREALKALSLAPEFDKVIALGVVRDADDDYKATFQSVSDGLSDINIIPPLDPVFFTKTKPSSGIFIMPSFNQKGSIEDLCLEGVKDNREMVCVNDFLNCLKAINPNLKQISKRKCLAFLATQDELKNNVGLAAKKGYWNFSSKLYNSLKTFLNELEKVLKN